MSDTVTATIDMPLTGKTLDDATRHSIEHEALETHANIDSSSQIPLIDAEPLLVFGLTRKETPAWRHAIDLMQYALKDIGFFSLMNHGLNASAARTASMAFFNQSLNQKKKRLQTPDFQFGYTCQGSEKLFLTETAQASKRAEHILNAGDPKEAYNVAPLHLTSIWPESNGAFDGSAFKSVMTRYYKDCEAFTQAFLPNVAIILGETPEFFVEKMVGHMSVVRTLHYPPAPYLSRVDLRASAHCDFGLLTLLQTFGTPGLQVENKSQQWIDVLPQQPDHLVVNIGDALSRMTNGAFKSTRHRVAPSTTERRQSIPYFVNFREDAIIEPVRKFRRTTGNYPAVKSGDYIFYKNGLAMGFNEEIPCFSELTDS